MARAIDVDVLANKIMEIWDRAENEGRTDIANFIANIIVPCIVGTPTIEPKQEWISVKDRLPEQYAVVIVYDGEQVGEAEFNGVDFCWVESEDLAFATHWMPFPEPPEKE